MVTPTHQQPASDEPQLCITVKQAAKRLSLSASQVYAMAASGEIPAIKLGGAVRVPVDELGKWLEDKKRAACGSWRGNQAALGDMEVSGNG